MNGPVLWLHVEITPGMGLFRQTAEEMCALANRMGINITADWNGYHMIAMPNITTPDQLLAMYDSLAARVRDELAPGVESQTERLRRGPAGLPVP